MQQRIPKYRRSEATAAALCHRPITAVSLELIQIIARYHLIPSSLLVQLSTANRTTVNSRLQALYHQQWLNRFFVPFPGRNPTEFIYYLDNPAALDLLVESGKAEKSTLPYDEVRRNREKNYAAIHDPTSDTQVFGRLLFVSHELKISRFHAMLETACQRSNGAVELLLFRQGPSLWRSVKAPKIVYNRETQTHEESEELEDIPHRPDAFFTLYFPNRPDGQQHFHFFYEADNGTMDSNRFAKKLRGHYQFIVVQKELQHIERYYGVSRIRAVLTETTNANQAELLRTAAGGFTVTSREKPSPLFWFTHSGLFERREPLPNGKPTPPRHLIQPEMIFNPLWVSAVGNQIHSLLDL